MRRPSSIEPFTPSPSVTLHPALQAVLDNLDVQIEEELTRYRRQRRYPTGVAQRRKPISPAPSGASASAIGILNSTIQLPSLGSSIYAADGTDAAKAHYAQANSEPATAARTAQPPHPTARPTASQTASQTVSQTVSQTSTALPPAAQRLEQRLEPLPPRPRESWQTAPTRMPHAEAQHLPAPAFATPASIPPDSALATITSYAQHNDLSAYAPNPTLQKLVHQSGAAVAPDDYLASSEELLRSIAEEDQELRAEREPNSMLDTLLTPLGIGSMLLLLLSSTTLGYVIMNPASLGLWTASRSTSSNSPTAADSKPGEAATPMPDLATEEFVDLDLDTLSTLPKSSTRAGATPGKTSQPTAKANGANSSKSNSSKANSTANRAANSGANGGRSITTAARSTAAPSVESLPTAPEPQPSLSTVVVPAQPPVMAVPAPAPAPDPAPQPAPEPAPVSPEPISATPPVAPVEASPEPTVATAPAATRPPYYYVVTDYSGDSSLQEARTAVPDAYVRNLPSEGAKVQLGAFSEEAKAQELLQQLQEQGIQAEVYQP